MAAPAVQRHSGYQRQRRAVFLPFALPAFILYTCLLVLPSLASFVISFADWKGLGAQLSWTGIDNYIAIFKNRVFLTSFLNTLGLTVVGGLLVFLLTMIGMLVLREARGKKLIRGILFVPYILSPIAIGVAVGFLFNPNGAVNFALRSLGLDALAQPWLSPDLIFKLIVLGFVWSVGGFYIALVMASVDSIPEDLYEAAALSGANRLQQFRYVTMPLSRDVLLTASVLWIINAIKVFEIVIAFTGTAGTPAVEARTVAVQQYLTVTGGRDGIPELGSGAAIGVLLFLLSALLVGLVRRLFRSEVYER